MEGGDAGLGAGHGLLRAVDVDVDWPLSSRREDRDLLRRDFHEAARNRDELLIAVCAEADAHDMRHETRDERGMVRQDAELAARRADNQHADVILVDHFIR